MQIISDLHIHSRFSRACSKDLTISNLEKYARIKGINLLGTSDFTHPEWIKELKQELTEDGTGILRTKLNPKTAGTNPNSTEGGFPFILSSEISLMYTDLGKGRRVHNVILAPSFEVVEQITEALKKRGRVDYDGRPIFKITCPEFVEMMHSISKEIEIIPAHAFTPYFGIFGSMSGFDSLKDAFQDKVKEIHAIETGLSSDPKMNWRLKELDNINLVSFSDSHSFWPWRLGREATVFEFKNTNNYNTNNDDNVEEELKNISYRNLVDAIRTGDHLWGTIEVDPNYGKYHFDGHRDCGISYHPSETKKLNGFCPVCKKPLTIGVMNRVEQLADKDRPEGFVPKKHKEFKSLIPLSELISFVLGKSISTKPVFEEHYKLIKHFGNEYNILLNVSEDELIKVTNKHLADLIIKNRNAELKFIAGYDGVYGKIVVDGKEYTDDKTNIDTKLSKKVKEKLTEKFISQKQKQVQKGLMDY